MLETLECGTPACPAVVLVAGFAFPELFSRRACVGNHCEYHGPVPSPAFPAPGRRKKEILHLWVGKSSDSPLLALLSVWGCCRNTELSFSLSQWALVGCAAPPASGTPWVTQLTQKRLEQRFPWNRNLVYPNYLLFHLSPRWFWSPAGWICPAAFPFPAAEHSQRAPRVIFNTACT